MQQKKNIRLIVSLCVLLMCTAIVYFFIRSTNETIVDKTLFQIADLKTIDRVELVSASEKVVLKFNGARWRVNDQIADVDMVDVLFATLQQAEPKRPLSATLKDSVDAALTKQGIAVRLFDGEILQKEFIAAGNANKTQAYFKDLDTDKWYVMAIPGYRVYTSGIFELNKNGWRDKYVFNFNWKNFKQLKASFPSNPKDNFEVEMGKEYYEIKGINADTAKLNDFLDAISLTRVDEYVNENEIPNLDSLLRDQPQMEIIVSDISGKTFQLAIYKLNEPEPIIGIVNANQPAYLSKRKLKDLVKSRSWFVKK